MRYFKTWKVGFALLAVLFTVSASAGVPWASKGPKRTIETLVLAGNYKSPRLMADLIQNESRQPYLLFPAPESGDTRIYFCPAKGPALEIPADQLNDYVNFLHPRRIVVLGNQTYLPDSAFQMLDRTIPIVRIEGKNWNLIAEELTFMLNLSNLAGNFKDLREQMNNSYKPTSLPRQLKEAKPVAAIEQESELQAASDAEVPAESENRTDLVTEETPAEAK